LEAGNRGRQSATYEGQAIVRPDGICPIFGRFGGFPFVNITEIMMVSKSKLISGAGETQESGIDAGIRACVQSGLTNPLMHQRINIARTRKDDEGAAQT
jgi:hypothetical protein